VEAVSDGRGAPVLYRALGLAYRGNSKLRTHTALGSYGRAVCRSIGLP